MGIPTAVAAVNTLCQCLDPGLCVTVQTVATKKMPMTLSHSEQNSSPRRPIMAYLQGSTFEGKLCGYMKLVGAVRDSGKKVVAKARGTYEFAFRKRTGCVPQQVASQHGRPNRAE